MRRYKRKGRRILTRFLGLWGESRHRRTPHRLRNLCDSRSSRTHRSRCPIPPQRRLSLLNSHLFEKNLHGRGYDYYPAQHDPVPAEYFEVVFLDVAHQETDCHDGQPE